MRMKGVIWRRNGKKKYRRKRGRDEVDIKE